MYLGEEIRFFLIKKKEKKKVILDFVSGKKS